MWERMKETVSLLEPRKNSLTFYYIDCLIGILIMVIVCYCKPHITGQYNHLYALNDKGFFIAHLLFAVDMMTCTNLWKGPVENHELAFTPATTNIKYNIDRLMTNCRNAVASRLLVILITSPWTSHHSPTLHLSFNPADLWTSATEAGGMGCMRRDKKSEGTIYFHRCNLRGHSMSTNTDD